MTADPEELQISGATPEECEPVAGGSIINSNEVGFADQKRSPECPIPDFELDVNRISGMNESNCEAVENPKSTSDCNRSTLDTDLKNALNDARGLIYKLRNERDSHRIEHKRVTIERDRVFSKTLRETCSPSLLGDMRRLKLYYQKYEPQIETLKYGIRCTGGALLGGSTREP